MKPATSNTKLISRELLCEADKSERKFLCFFFLPSALGNATEAEVDVISPASLSMPLTYYIVFSSCASPKFVLFNKTEVARLFSFSSGQLDRERENSTNLDLAENSNGHERNSCYRAITVLGLSTDGNAPLGNFPRQVFPGQDRNFRRGVSGGGGGQFPRHFHIKRIQQNSIK